MKKILSIIVIVLMLFSIAYNNVRSVDKLKELEDEIEREKKNIETIKKAIDEINSNIVDITQNKSTETVKLNQIENKYSKLSLEITELEKEEESLINSYNKTSTLLDNISIIIQESERKVNESIFVLYKNYSLNYSAYFFSSKSFNEIMDKSIYLQFLLEVDKNNIKKIKDNKAKYSDLMQEQVDKQVKLSLVKDEKKTKLEELKILEKNKEQEIQQLTRRLETNQSQSDFLSRELEESNRKITQLIKEEAAEILRRRVKQTPMGKLIWPVNGPVSSFFGMRMHPIFGEMRMHTGIDIDADYGVPILAVQSGVVIFVGWLGGYGNTVVILHDQIHSTLYAHMRSFNTSKDAEVSQGAVIGKVGSTGWATGPHLHFEVRINGEPTNPLDYLP
jgi:murein DD-endopeptidase MepM/ murein hydrolase activator NlpD